MSKILHIKDGDGNWVDVPAIEGPSGYTPVRGVDYWTDDDRAVMVDEVIAALPKYGGEMVEL